MTNFKDGRIDPVFLKLKTEYNNFQNEKASQKKVSLRASLVGSGLEKIVEVNNALLAWRLWRDHNDDSRQFHLGFSFAHDEKTDVFIRLEDIGFQRPITNELAPPTVTSQIKKSNFDIGSAINRINVAIDTIKSAAKTFCERNNHDAAYWRRRSVEILYQTDTPTNLAVDDQNKPDNICDAVSALESKIDVKREELLTTTHLNDPCVAVSSVELEGVKNNGTPNTLDGYTLDFATIAVLRDAERNDVEIDFSILPYQVSANALVICPEMGALVFQNRKVKKGLSLNDENRGLLHTFGGGFLAPRGIAASDLWSLERNARREVFEESNIALPHVEKIPAIGIRQDVPSFFQFAFLGHTVSVAEVSAAQLMQSNPEGGIKIIRYSELLESLSDPDAWVTSGMASVAAWLALGAPGAVGANFSRNGLGTVSAGEAFEELLGEWNEWKPRLSKKP